MRALLFLAITVATAPTLPCPSQYELIEGRCIRVLELFTSFILDDKLPGYRSECGNGGHFPVIKNDKENQDFADILYSLNGNEWESFFLVMDLVCNNTTRRLEWADGSPVTYSRKNSVDFNFDCVTTQQTAISREHPGLDDWFLVSTTELYYYYTVLCEHDSAATTTKPTTTTVKTTTPTTTTSKTTPTGQCGDYSVMDTLTNPEKPCIKVYTDPISWNNASQKCASEFASLITINSADENKYLWRAALSNNILEGMHIGAHESPADSSVWTWSDGEIPFNGKTYDNFMSIFPIPGGGECSSMMTGTSAAYWINEHCDENDQPFMCRRADFSALPKSCPTDVPKAGDDIYSPGIPNSDIPCGYMLFVAANKLVELEVITLVADDNKDFLELLEGTSGPHLLANLTGKILAPTKFTTTKSNVLRMNWAPGGSGSGRGFRIRYNQVDA